MDAFKTESKPKVHQCKSDEASSAAFDMSILKLTNELSASNENFDSNVIDETREYTPAEVLEWETELYTEEHLATERGASVNDDNEEEKSKSTVDSTEKASSKKHNLKFANSRLL